MGKVVVQPQQPIVVKVKPGSSSGADQFARDIANAAFNQANSGARTAFTSILVDGANTIYANSNTATLTLIASTGILLESDPGNNSVSIVATGGSAFDEYARDKANGAVQVGYTHIDANGTLLIPESNADTLILTSVQANGIGIAANSDTQTIDIFLQPSGVTAGTYGNTKQFVILTIDEHGRITAASNATPQLHTDMFAGGVLPVARGGTGYGDFTDGQILVGNTATNQFDKGSLIEGNGIAIDIVSGNVTISSNITLPIQSRSISYGYPLLGEIVTFFWTNTAITLSHIHSVVAGISPNIKYDLIFTDDRANTAGTLIIGDAFCDNVNRGIELSSFTNSFIPANNFILIHTKELVGSVDELALTLFFSNQG